MNVDRFRVRQGDRSTLKGRRPDSTGPFTSKDAALEHLAKGLERLEVRQEQLYAHGQYALLLIFQGMDASGKDSAIEHVMSGVDPQGTEVHSFKRPSYEELGHDFLWRTSKVLPERGKIGIFNRSYYEEVLIVRVHPELLVPQRLPPECVTRNIWKERFEDIRAFERHLARNGTIIRKFFLHISKSEQKKRLLARLDDPAKNWKFSIGDLPERDKWTAYMSAYQDALGETSSPQAPWYVVPADHKWFARALIADVIVKTLDDLDLSFPKMTEERRRELREARRRLTLGS